jgi:hypothetical protein
MPETFDIEEAILDALEWEEGDRGIGHYEFWGMLERDVNIQAVLKYNEVDVDVAMPEDNYNCEWIPLSMETGTKVWMDDNNGYDVNIMATLTKAKSTGSGWTLTYEVSQR